MSLADEQKAILKDAPLIRTDTHRYFKGPVELPSLTRVMRLGGYGEDFSGVPPAVLEFARARGEAVHAAADLLMHGELDEASVVPEIAPYVEQFGRWHEKERLTGADNEKPICDLDLGLACTPDILHRESTTMIEIKTTSKISKFIGVQLAGQVMCATRGGGDWKRMVLWLKKDGYSYERAVDYGDPFEAMRSALACFNWKKAAGLLGKEA